MKNLVIEKSAIKQNIRALKTRTKGVAIIADLMGDAFGLGLVPTARLLRDESIRAFAVSDPKDAKALRAAGFTEERIMMPRSTADTRELEELLDYNVVCTVGSYDAAVALNSIAESRRTVCEVQIKIDSGFGRYGFTPDEIEKIMSIHKYMPKLVIVGIMSSYSVSWKNKRVTELQLDRFKNVISELKANGLDTGMASICDSSALFRYDDLDLLDAVRVGTVFSGRVAGGPFEELREVGYIEAGIEEVGWFQKGHRVGMKVLKHPTKLAVLSVGYYHGFGVSRPRPGESVIDYLKSRRAMPAVRVGGEKVKIVGDIGMMHTIVDVTKQDCHVGDIAEIDVDPAYVKGLHRVYR